MRVLSFGRLASVVGIVCLALSGAAVAQDLVPAKRIALSQDTDYPGGDIATMLDTTLEACEKACLSNRLCTAFTFNTRNGSCFPKSAAGEGTFFQGAFSGRVLTAEPGIEARARERRADLRFLPDWDIAAATEQAAGLGNQHTTGAWSAEEHLASASQSEAEGNFDMAAQFTGAALNLSDDAGTWVEYARRLFEAGNRNTQQQRAFHDRAFWASVNGYLRAEAPGLRHTALVQMGLALERIDRGRDTVQAYRLAQSLQARDDTGALLDAAVGKYGFRITEHEVQSDSARPRICATFSEDLATAGVDYGSFVQMPETGMTVTAGGCRQLCVEGLSHGARYTVTFREGLPAADGQSMAKSVPITAYVRDRSPGVRFPGRAYVLPKSGSAALPVETVNAEKLELTLYAVSDRNLLRSLQNDYFGTPMPEYQEGSFSGEVGSQIWTGTATVGMEVNRDVTTRLPLDEAIAGLPAGIYALKAAVPGVDPYVVGAAWQWFVISDLGTTTMSGVDGLHVFVRSLGTAAAKPGVSVELLSRANAVLGTAVTDEMGYARFEPGLTRGTGGASPALVVLREGESDIAFLSLTDPEFDLSDRGVEGREPAPPVDVFLTTDRGAYRAGETVYATALARDAKAAALPGLPLTAVLKRPDGVEYSRALVADGGAGGHVFALPVAGSAPRGVWRLEVLADLAAEPLAARTFLVEDFLPERIDFDLTLADGPLRPGAVAPLTVDARYLFGAPGADLAIEGEVLVREAKDLAAWPGYVFGRQDEPFNARMESLPGGVRTDASGQAVLDMALPAVEAADRPLEARVTVRVAEGSGRPVERQVVRALTPAAPMIGVKPLFDGVVAEGAEARFALVGVGADEAAAPMAVTWELTRIETRYQWYQSFGNWNWEPVVSSSFVTEGTATLGAGPVEIAAPVQWGEYRLTVTRSDGAAAETTTRFHAGWYAPADTTATPDTLELSLDRPAYKAGDTAVLRIVPRAAGTALVTVLSNRLVAMQAVEVTEGENLISLPVTDDWGAGVYVTASVLRPMDVAAGRNPARALGLTHAAVDPGARKLVATVETAPEAAPRGPMEVAVKVEGIAAGDTAYATIAAVDVGILNLTGFESPDPTGHYFGQRKLGIGIRDVYGRLIDGLNGVQGVVRSGGDAGAGARLQAPPPTEELVAYFTGPVQVGADGYARASFDLPSFNGTVRVMAVIWSDTAVGQAEADVLVRDPVVVTASLPRFLSPGDESRLLLEIVHASGPSGRMGLDVTANGVTLGSVPSGFDLGDKAKAVFAVPLTAGAVGVQSVDVALTTPDGKQLKKRLQIPVQVNDPELARTSRFKLAPGQSFTFDANVFAGLAPGSGSATLAIGPLARLNAPGLLAALDRYPYGCTEQITSKAMPLLYFDQVAQAMQLGGADNIAQRINEAVAEILTNQTSEGAFGMWRPESGDMWLDAYVTDFLSRARAQGHAVPDGAFRQALDNLRNQVNYTADFDSGGEGLSYALMVLAREGAAAVGDLRYYADVKGDAFSTPVAQAQLGAALASYGDQTRADAMFRRAGAKLTALPGAETDQVFRIDYGTHYRDAAAVLTLAAEAGSQAVDRAVLTDRIAARGTGLSTQEATWALLATNALIDRPGTEGLTIDGAAPNGPLVRVLEAQAASVPVVVANGGTAPTTLTVTTYGVPSEPEPAGGNGYAITRSYYTLEGEPATVDSVKAGTRLVTVLEVTPFGSGEARLMVADPLPAGFEIDNPNLIKGGSISALDWLGLEEDVAHSEFRQDRFLTAVNRTDSTPFRLAYVVRAVSPGVFHHPAASVEDMYRPDFRARTDAGRITINE
ncbi:alpha-2-macroglobulin family protein [Paracoccaceae bacterium Fryx2]|nr:alpha-2-macroglobulin family protein [Paracoccaceae bacterium Fryx2]